MRTRLRNAILEFGAVILGVVLFGGCGGDKGGAPRVVAKTPEEAGRYLVRIGACNDCHTPGFDQAGEQVPEVDWLTGVAMGYRGPWGTTYAGNLRIYVQEQSEDAWIKEAASRNAKPPMPWVSLHALNESDARAIYRYIKSLGPKGEKAPEYVPPDQEPKTPFFYFVPQGLPTQGGAGAPSGPPPTAPSH